MKEIPQTGHNERSTFWKQQRKANPREAYNPPKDVMGVIKASFPNQRNIPVFQEPPMHPIARQMMIRNMRRVTRSGR